MTLEAQIEAAIKAAKKAMDLTREARNASQLLHGGSNYSRTTELLNNASDTLSDVYESLRLSAAPAHRQEESNHAAYLARLDEYPSDPAQFGIGNCGRS